MKSFLARFFLREKHQHSDSSNSWKRYVIQYITMFLMANPHSECNRILRGSRPGATYDDACGDMHHWRHHGRLQPSVDVQ